MLDKEVGERMEILIIGGGSVGEKLASELGEPFNILEGDPSRVFELRNKLDDSEVRSQVFHGDGSSRDDLERAGANTCDVGVVLMNKDMENLQCAMILKDIGVKRIIARVNQASNMYRFIGIGTEVFLHPMGHEEGLIRTMLFPDMNHAIQVFVGERSPTIGRSIRELNLPSGSMIGAILRGDELLPGDPGTIIRSGDLIAIDTIGKKAREVWKIFSRSGKEDLSGHLLFPLFKDRSLEAIKEAELLALRLGSEIAFIVQPGREELHTAALGFISTKIPTSSITSGEKGEMVNFLEGRPKQNIIQRKRKKLILEEILHAHLRDESHHIDILVVPGPKGRTFYSPFFSNNLDRLIQRSPMPVLVSRSYKPYRNILVYLHKHMTLEIPYAIQLSRAMGSEITAMYTTPNRKKAVYMKHFAGVYKVMVNMRRVEGNPTVELIKEVKENHYGLIIIRKNLRELQYSQVRRLIHLWNGSILMVP